MISDIFLFILLSNIPNSALSNLPVTIEPAVGKCSAILENATSSGRIGQLLNTSVIPYLNYKYGEVSAVCGGPGWKRAFHLDLSDSNSHCPPEWRLFTNTVRGCHQTNVPYACSSTHWNNNGSSYSRICGRILAYGEGTLNGFFAYITGLHTTIDSAYVVGLSVTHGSPRQHIWTFVGSLSQQYIQHTEQTCPCTASASQWPHQIPPFVGNHYFCDSGNPGPGYEHHRLYPDAPLWDGAGCPHTSTCCQFNNPPWFYRSLPQATMDDIEVRMCSGDNNEDVYVTLMEIYVA